MQRYLPFTESLQRTALSLELPLLAVGLVCRGGRRRPSDPSRNYHEDDRAELPTQRASGAMIIA